MTRRDLALSLLEDAGPRGVTTAELLDSGVGSRYGARLLELRKQGYVITSERIRDGAWRYVLDAPGNARRENPSPKGVPSGAETEGSQLSSSVSVGTAGGAMGDVPGHLFSLPDAYEELRRKDAA